MRTTFLPSSPARVSWSVWTEHNTLLIYKHQNHFYNYAKRKEEKGPQDGYSQAQEEAAQESP
jgi:Fe-S cluster biosynthesis and repair protein YggX